MLQLSALKLEILDPCSWGLGWIAGESSSLEHLSKLHLDLYLRKTNDTVSNPIPSVLTSESRIQCQRMGRDAGK